MATKENVQEVANTMKEYIYSKTEIDEMFDDRLEELQIYVDDKIAELRNEVFGEDEPTPPTEQNP